MRTKIKKAFVGYIGSFSVYGFFRGWISEYRYNRYDGSIDSVRYNLVTEKYFDRCFRGFVNATFYATFGHGFALYRLICRTEIQYLRKNPYDHKDAYSEVFGYISLPPKKKE